MQLRAGGGLVRVLVAAALMTVGSVVVVPTRSGLRLTPEISVVAALPFLTGQADGVALFSRRESIAVVLFGVAATWVIRAAGTEGRRRLLADAVRRIAASLVYLSVVGSVGPVVLESGAWAPAWWEIVSVAVGGTAAWVIDVVFGAAVRIGRPTREQRHVNVIEGRDFDVYVALLAAGALFGLSFGLVGWWALIMAGLPYAFAHGAFRRFADTQRTYSQTIRALARIPEAAGYVHAGHADRTAELAAAVARRLGVRPGGVELIERASFLHDIGRITLNDPGVARLGFTDDDIAQWGAEIVDEAGLTDVAELIRRHNEPYRRPGQERELGLPLAARIVKASSAYDEAVSELGLSPLEALERLHEGSVYDYDPEIVGALRTVLDERGAFTPAEITGPRPNPPTA
jgi:hypothetical protein